MRGGALPVLAWAAILAVLFAGNWIWEGEPGQTGPFAFAVVVALLFAAGQGLHSRQALRRGPPATPPRGEVQASPDFSFGAAGIAVGVAIAVFGLAFGHFVLYFGFGLIVLSLGRLLAELRAERAAVRALRTPAAELDGPATGQAPASAAREEALR